MKQISKIIEIPANSTINQMELSLNNLLKNNWELITIFILGNKTYAVLIKKVVF